MALIDRINKVSNRQELTVIPGSMQELPKAAPFSEIGVSGLLRTSGTGYVFEEFLAELSSYKQKQVYREMRDNDAVIGAMFFALEMILRRSEWRVEPAKGKKGDQYGEFVKSCMTDMSMTWEDFIAECVSEFAFGFALFETVYKRRQGHDGKKPSRFDDGLIGWRKFAPRAQESILYWIWDDEGGLQGAVQLAAPDYRTVPIPIEKLLLFRTTSSKNNPEGRSLLRNCYRSWSFKRRIEEVEGIGIERDLCGLPVIYASGEVIESIPGGLAALKKMVTNIRMDNQAGVVLPMIYDDKGNPGVKLELLRSGGSKVADVNAAISRYNADMLNTILAGFVQFGESPHGSKALHMSATAIFSLAISAFMDSIAATVNRIAIPRLMVLNRMDLEYAPKLVPGEIGVRDLNELSEYISKLAASGLTFFDAETAGYLRKIARLPDAPEEAEAPPPGASVTGTPLVPVPGTSEAQTPPSPKEPVAEKPTPSKPEEQPAVPVKPKGAAPPSGNADAESKLQGVA
jgi:hypothetical protein